MHRMEIIKGAVEAVALREDIKVLLVGKEELIREKLKAYSYREPQIEVVNATEVIETAEPPVAAIRKKKDSSIVVGMKLVKEGSADAFVSAGSSGAVLVGGQLLVGRIKGIERPPLAPLIPTEKGVSLLIDCGANVDARPSHLVQFAKMGSIYMEDVVGVKNPKVAIVNPLPRNKVVLAVSILLVLIFSKYFYMASISSYYTFYLMQKFGLSIQNAQLHLFAFLFAVAAGTVIGGPVGDKIGRKYVIWGSILGVAPFTLILPYASLHWTGVLTVIIGFILASAFSAILVYAQELLPGRIGMVSGLFFGFAFGMGGLGAAVLGLIADHTSIELVYKICAFLPLLGMLTIFLPDNRHKE